MHQIEKRKLWRRITALLCAGGIILGGAPSRPVLADDIDMDEAKDQIASLNQTYDQLEKQKKELANKIYGVQSEKKRQSEEKNELEQQISLTSQQIEVLTEKIAYLDGQIQQQEEAIEQNDEDIEEKQLEIEHNEELLKQRIRRSYMAGDPTTLEVLLGSDSFYNMLSSTTMVTRMVNRDKDFLAELAEQKLSLQDDHTYLENLREENERIKESFEENKAENEEARSLQNEKAESLEEDVEKIRSSIQTLEDTEREYYANQAKIQKEMQEAQAEVTKIYAMLEEMRKKNQSGNDEYTGGQFGWPLPGYSMLTSYYGWRFNNSDFHTGLDISGSQCYGKTVVAANPGTVAFVNTAYKAGVGYGIYLIIDHGGGYSTLYAHLSAIDVNVGDVVARGTPIAKVGATGWATGPHLHFEVRIDGKTQNPLSYLGSPS